MRFCLVLKKKGGLLRAESQLSYFAETLDDCVLVMC